MLLTRRSVRFMLVSICCSIIIDFYEQNMSDTSSEVINNNTTEQEEHESEGGFGWAVREWTLESNVEGQVGETDQEPWSARTAVWKKSQSLNGNWRVWINVQGKTDHSSIVRHFVLGETRREYYGSVDFKNGGGWKRDGL